MKKVLILLALALFSCSTEEPETPPEQLTRPDFYIFLYETCSPNGNYEKPYVTEEEYDKHIEYLRSTQEPCVILTVTDYKGDTYSGYYGGGGDPRN